MLKIIFKCHSSIKTNKVINTLNQRANIFDYSKVYQYLFTKVPLQLENEDIINILISDYYN